MSEEGFGFPRFSQLPGMASEASRKGGFRSTQNEQAVFERIGESVMTAFRHFSDPKDEDALDRVYRYAVSQGLNSGAVQQLLMNSQEVNASEE